MSDNPRDLTCFGLVTPLAQYLREILSLTPNCRYIAMLRDSRPREGQVPMNVPWEGGIYSPSVEEWGAFWAALDALSPR